MNMHFLSLILLIFVLESPVLAEKSPTKEKSDEARVLVDVRYVIGHGWGHVLHCDVVRVVEGEFSETSFEMDVNGADFDRFQKEKGQMAFSRHVLRIKNQGRAKVHVGISGFRDGKSNFWRLEEVSPVLGDNEVKILVDVHYVIGHGWGNVYQCWVVRVLEGNFEETSFAITVSGTDYDKFLGSVPMRFLTWEEREERKAGWDMAKTPSERKEFSDFSRRILRLKNLGEMKDSGWLPGFQDAKSNFWRLEEDSPFSWDEKGKGKTEPAKKP